MRGTRGALVFGFAGLGLLAKGDAYDPERWVEPAPAAGEPMPIEQWVSAMRTGADTSDNTSAAVELTRLVEAANAAASSGRTLDYRVPTATR